MNDHEPILIVDDDREVAETLREFLEQAGYAVRVAHTGAAGVEALHAAPLSIAVLDLELPDTDGVELMRAAQRLAMPPDVIIITGHPTLDSATEAVNVGAAAYILKPINLVRLGALVRRILEERALVMRRMFTASPEGIMFVGVDGRVHAANREALRLLEVGPDRLIGLRLADSVGKLRGADALLAFLEHPTESGVGDLGLAAEARVVCWTVQRTSDSTGATLGFAVTLRDVTGQRRGRPGSSRGRLGNEE